MTMFFMLFSVNSYAADPNKPHPHKGKAEVFTVPSKTTLTASEVSTIKSDKPILKQVQQGNGGRGIAVMDLNASQEKIWGIITDYEKYPTHISDLKDTQNYKKTDKHVYTHFTLSSMMMTVEYYVKHTLNEKDGYVTWTLDYDRYSDLDDSTGYWYLYPSPDNPGKTRVEYTIDVRVSGWVPKFIQTALAERGLKDATKWVKKAAEK